MKLARNARVNYWDALDAKKYIIAINNAKKLIGQLIKKYAKNKNKQNKESQLL